MTACLEPATAPRRNGLEADEMAGTTVLARKDRDGPAPAGTSPSAGDPMLGRARRDRSGRGAPGPAPRTMSRSHACSTSVTMWDDRSAVAPLRPDRVDQDREELAPGERVEARERLVEQQDGWPGCRARAPARPGPAGRRTARPRGRGAGCRGSRAAWWRTPDRSRGGASRRERDGRRRSDRGTATRPGARSPVARRRPPDAATGRCPGPRRGRPSVARSRSRP